MPARQPRNRSDRGQPSSHRSPTLPFEQPSPGPVGSLRDAPAGVTYAVTSGRAGGKPARAGTVRAAAGVPAGVSARLNPTPPPARPTQAAPAQPDPSAPAIPAWAAREVVGCVMHTQWLWALSTGVRWDHYSCACQIPGFPWEWCAYCARDLRGDS